MKNDARPIIWNYGGGWQTAAIAVLIEQGVLPVPERAVIADTGREMPSTWEYLDNYMRPILSKVGLEVEVIPHSYSKYDLYDEAGLTLMPAWTPNGQTRNFCSGNWKRDVVYRFLREPERGYGPKSPIVQWIGFSKDEMGRTRRSDRKWVEIQWPLIYPLAMTRLDCARAILDRGLPLPRKSRCYDCPYQTNSEWREQRDLYPETFALSVKDDREVRERDPLHATYLHKDAVPLSEANLDEDDPHPVLFATTTTCTSGQGCWT